MKRVFVMIRDKLGDTVIAFQALSEYSAAHPEDHLTVMVHKHYLPLFEREAGYHFVPYASSFQAFTWAIWQRIILRRYDVILVLRGTGIKVISIARILSGKLRIHALNRYPDVFPDTPPDPGCELTSKEHHIEAAMRALRSLDPELSYPERLHLQGLATYLMEKEAVVICPVSDEVRRTLSRDDVMRMLPEIRKRHRERKIWILVRNSGEGGFFAGDFAGAEVHPFQTVTGFLTLFGKADAYYGVDTGLYHVAAAMGIPAVVFFGPSQPYRVIMPAQKTEAVRLVPLGSRHCENKACPDPVCIHQAVADWSGVVLAKSPLPVRCPLDPNNTEHG
jgi:ADP-heptose:LPS heptosyltransferase